MERKTFRILFLLRKSRTGKNGLAPILARITTNGLNPDPKDNISDEQLSEIAGEYMERMGCGGQPYIVFKYDDIDRRHMERSKDKITKGNNREQIRHRVAEAMLDCPTENELRERLRAVGIDLYLRRNAAKRITGVTFIDHQNRCVLNGSRHGKEFSADVMNEKYPLSQNTDIVSLEVNHNISKKIACPIRII